MRRILIAVLALTMIIPGITLAQINWTAHWVATYYNGAFTVQGIDMDLDGDYDVLACGTVDSSICWWQNDGQFIFTQRTVGENIPVPRDAYGLDIDGDNDIDVVGTSSTGDYLAWYENNGAMVFTEHRVRSAWDGAYDSYALDLDRDGDIDLLGAAYRDDDVSWFENDGNQNFTERLIEGNFDGAHSVYACDLDNDADIDVISCSCNGNQVAVWENDGNQNFTQRIICPYLYYGSEVHAEDLDSDGDMDVLCAASRGAFIMWWRNDGSMTFVQDTVCSGFTGSWDVQCGDIDLDGDIDVLGAAWDCNQIAWFENDGNQNFTLRLISAAMDNARGVWPVDIDQDGDLDVLGTAQFSDQIKLWESDLDPVSGLLLTLAPQNPPIVVPSGGGSFVFDASVENGSADPITFDAWSEVILPDGRVYGPLILRNGNVIPAGATILRQITQNVPPAAPPGSYTYIGNAGNYPDSVLSTDSFPFVKLPSDGAPPAHNLGWAVSGWDDDEEGFRIQDSGFGILSVNPNPFNSSTSISYKLQAASSVKLAIYDIAGREVAVLAQGFYPAGTHQVMWDGTAIASGVYFARLTAGYITRTQKLTLIK